MSKLTSMAKDLLIIDEDFSWRSRDMTGGFIGYDYYDLHIFDQWWPDTSCGFGGIAGQAFTQRTVYAFVPKDENIAIPTTEQPDAIIYIGNRFAYKAPKSDLLVKDITCHNIRPVYSKEVYFTADKTEDSNE